MIASYPEDNQLELWPGTSVAERSRYLTDQLITYLGNKRALLAPIGNQVYSVKQRLGKDNLRIFDAFSGSGVVSRYLKAHASYLVSNDIERYASVISECYLRNRGTVDFAELSEIVDTLNLSVLNMPYTLGLIERLYSPRDESAITESDRVFYTSENARRLDNYRRLINIYSPDIRTLLLGPLLSEASIHANTAGMFKSFYRDKSTGIGQYGGTSRDALHRITGRIELAAPILSKFECDYEVLQGDANEIASAVKDIDLAYIDPPYNQHSYGSNYFMLNLLVDYKEPQQISKMSGIPKDWTRSGYNVKSQALDLLIDLLDKVDAKFLLISFSNDGFSDPTELSRLFQQIGIVKQSSFYYNTFRGSRNLKDRTAYVTEQLFLVEKR